LADNVPLRIVTHYSMPAGTTGMRQWLSRPNMGTAPLLFLQCTQIQPAPRHDMVAFGDYGEEPCARAADLTLLLENATTGESYLW
jgi:hypothetical protein